MSDADETVMCPVASFDIPVDDFEKAESFYSIFDWEMNYVPEWVYTKVTTTTIDESKIPLALGAEIPVDKGAINGGIMKRISRVCSPVITIQVEFIDAYLAKVALSGGEIVVPKIVVPGVAYYAYIADPAGNILALWEPTKNA